MWDLKAVTSIALTIAGSIITIIRSFTKYNRVENDLEKMSLDLNYKIITVLYHKANYSQPLFNITNLFWEK